MSRVRWIRRGGAGAGGGGGGEGEGEGECEGVIRGDDVSYLHRAFERFDKAHGCFEAAYNLKPEVETLNRLENNLTRLTECRKMLMAAEGKVDQALVGASAGGI